MKAKAHWDVINNLVTSRSKIKISGIIPFCHVIEVIPQKRHCWCETYSLYATPSIFSSSRKVVFIRHLAAAALTKLEYVRVAYTRLSMLSISHNTRYYTHTDVSYVYSSCFNLHLRLKNDSS